MNPKPKERENQDVNESLEAEVTKLLASRNRPISTEWQDYDTDTRTHIVSHVARYADPQADEKIFGERAERATKVLMPLETRIRNLKKALKLLAHEQTLERAQTEIGAELEGLKMFRKEVKVLFNERRWGVPKHPFWLVVARFTAQRWGHLHGRDSDLSAIDLADLLELIQQAQGKEVVTVNPDTLQKAHDRFALHPRNARIMERLALLFPVVMFTHFSQSIPDSSAS